MEIKLFDVVLESPPLSGWRTMGGFALGLALVLAGAPAGAQETAKQESGAGGLWLDTVVVSATRTEDSVRDLPISPVVISEEDIKRHPNADLSDLLEDAGIMIDRQYYLGGQVVLRGLSGNISGADVQSDVLMLLNGHRIGTGSMLRFPSKNIERIEILRGPAALQYGSAAMGGVVNVITKKGSGDFSAFGEAGVGSWSRYDYTLGFSGEQKALDYSFAYSQMQQSSDYKTGKGQTYLGTTTDKRAEASFNLGYNFNEKHRLGVIYSHIKLDDYGFTGSIYDMTNVLPMAGSVANYLTRTSGEGNMVDFSYEGATEDDRFAWQGKYFIGRDKQEGQTVNASYTNDLQGAQGSISGNFDEINTSLTLGFDWTEYDFETESSNLSHYKYTDLGGYLLGKLRFMDDRLVFTGGARLNYNRNKSDDNGGHKFSEIKITPSLGASYLATDWLKLRANYAKGYRAPAANEMFGEGQTMVGRHSTVVPIFMGPMIGMRDVLVNRVWLVPNFDLKPQESDSIELGFDAEYNGFKGSVTGFYSKFHDKIERLDIPYGRFNYTGGVGSGPYNGYPVGFPNPDNNKEAYAAMAQYVNFGDAEMAGLEWSLKWDLGETYDWGFTLAPYSNGTFLPKAKYDGGPESGLRMRKVPRWYTSYGLEFEQPDYGLWADFNFLTRGRQRTNNLTSDPNIDDWQPSWTTANLKVEKSLYERGGNVAVSLQGEISNVFDRYYEVTPTYPLPGRAFYVGLRFDYN